MNDWAKEVNHSAGAGDEVRIPAASAEFDSIVYNRSSRPHSAYRSSQHGQVAQVVERSPEKAGVGGSTPSLATIFSTT